jgi:hypothetical protein
VGHGCLLWALSTDWYCRLHTEQVGGGGLFFYVSMTVIAGVLVARSLRMGTIVAPVVRRQFVLSGR